MGILTSKHRAAELALLGVTLIWGVTFLVVKIGLQWSGPFAFVALRFGAAALVVWLLAPKALKGIQPREAVAGGLIGLTIFLGYALQTAGLQSISSSQSAFITALYVPMVPLLQWGLTRRMPKAMTWAGVALAFAGLTLLAGPGALSFQFSRGEALTLIGAVAIAAEILLISRYAGSVDLRRVTLIQLAVASGLAFVAVGVGPEAMPAFSWQLAITVISLGIASALIQVVMNWAQKAVSATKATLIYATEPVWAGIVGRMAGERLTSAGLVGAALIVTGVIASELKLPSAKRDPVPG